MQNILRQAAWSTVQNTVEIFTTAPLSYFLMSVKENELEKVSDLPYFIISVKEIKLEKVSVSDI